MKIIALTVATALLLTASSAKTVENQLAAKKLEQNSWPDIKYYKSFKMSSVGYYWNGWELTDYYGYTATTLFDATRDKIITHGKVK